MKNVGVNLLLVCCLRPTTALQVDEQSDTHVRITDTRKVCVEGHD